MFFLGFMVGAVVWPILTIIGLILWNAAGDTE